MGTCHRGVSARWAHKTLTRLFPQLGPVDFVSAWEGQIAMTADHLPKIYQLDDGLFTPIGYNGRGITTGTLFGHSMAGLLAGDDPTHLPLPLTTMSRQTGRRLGALLLRSIFATNQLVKSW
jgi:glycine/D-amino acid oxidase-like deaminating enzyme